MSSIRFQTFATRIASGRRWVVIAMLLALHAALVSQPGEVMQRIWLMVHFGLFLMWQPFFATERELDPLSALMLLAVTAATLYFLAGWMVVMWLVLLLGVLGGRVFTVQAARSNRFYLVAFTYVLTMLLLWSVPEMVLKLHLPDAVGRIVRTVLPLGLLPLLFLPLPREENAGPVFDFFYAVLVFQLCVVLALGSIVAMRFTEDNYIESVLLTVLVFALALFALAVLWNPMRGFGGLRTYFSRYLLSVGMPFELWMRRIAELAETEPEPRRFLEEALREISAFPWMRGGRWKSPDGDGSFGEVTEYATHFAFHRIEFEFYTGVSLAPSLFLHVRLLAQVVAEFYEGKRRESALRRASYLEAVHETGARLTHDVKNLLQSLYAITSMAPKESADGYDGLLQRQLPQLTRRLQATIDGLRTPEIPTSELPVRASVWWAEVERRMAGADVALDATISADGNIPAALFDGFVENAIDNARAKALREPGVKIRISFEFGPANVELSVCDDGSAIPEAAAQRLFREPIERASGLGIGLYHTARLAAQSGWHIEIAANRDGDVRFRLAQSGERAERSAAAR